MQGMKADNRGVEKERGGADVGIKSLSSSTHAHTYTYTIKPNHTAIIASVTDFLSARVGKTIQSEWKS